jgi:hypothetical protein
MQSLPHLLSQSTKIDEIRLYIPKTYRRFPDYDGRLPEVPQGVRIIRPDEDLGPASKVLFAADDLKGTDCDIIYCDDDRTYHRTWFEKMLAARGLRSDIAVATSGLGHVDEVGILKPSQHGRPPVRTRPSDLTLGQAKDLLIRKIKQLTTGVIDPKPPMLVRYHKPGFVHIAEGFGAVLVKPDFFDASMFEIPPVLWTVDDIWLSGHLERRGIGILCAAGFPFPTATDAHDFAALGDSEIEGADRFAANSACVKYMQETYGIWL